MHALGGKVMAMGPADVMFMPSPITHATGLAMGVIAPLILGAGIHLMDIWDPGEGPRRGDLGRVDDAGYLRLTGRIKDLIIRGGLNISAPEVEDHLLAHPRVAAAVVAVPDVRMGEKACALVVPHGEPSTLPGLTEFLRRERRIAPQKLPEMLIVVAALPTTMTGKVQKFLLRDQARAAAGH